MAQYRRCFLSRSIDDRRIRKIIAELYRREGYLIDPHGAVAFPALLDVTSDLVSDSLSLATAHPSKFQRVVADALQVPISECPPAVFQASLEHTKGLRSGDVCPSGRSSVSVFVCRKTKLPSPYCRWRCSRRRCLNLAIKRSLARCRPIGLDWPWRG